MPANKKIKVLFALDNLTVGGAQQLVLSLVQSLARDRYEPVVCTLFSGRSQEPELLFDAVRAAGAKAYRLSISGWRDFKTFWQFKEILAKEQIDLVHSHMVPADFWSSLLGKLCAALPVVYTRHGIYSLNGPASRFQNFLLNKILADRVVAISEAVTDNLSKVCGTPEKRIVHIVNGVDTCAFNPSVSGKRIREELGLQPNDFVVGNCSRFEIRKGYDIFLRVAEMVARDRPNVKFLAVGHGSQEQALREKARQSACADQIVFAPARLDVPEVLGTMDVFLFTPYLGEGLPLVVLEAMASGLPVIASNIGSNREIVQPGVTGFLPFPKNWQAETDYLDGHPFAEKVAFFADNPPALKEMGRNGRKLILEKFDQRTMVENHQTLYESLLWTT
ncbi:MAG: glycosyltransferase [bacterium]